MNSEKEKYAKVSAGIIAAAAAAGAGAYAVTDFFLKLALDRTIPKSVKRASGLVSHSKKSNEFLNDLHDAENRLLKTDSTEIVIRAHDGVKLVGHWKPAKNPERIIVAMHGWRSTWAKDFGMVSEAWEEHNCSVLYAEQRGQNNSEGDFIGFGITERYDVVDWVKWVIANCGHNLPVYLAGVSMGATTVLMASDLGLPVEVHGIMADCGFTSPDQIWTYIANNNLHLVYRAKRVIADSLYRKKTHESSDHYSTTDALRNTDIPVFFAHGTDDHFVPVEMTYENYKACKAPKRLLIVPGAGHGMSYYLEREKYTETVERFFSDFDHYERTGGHLYA